MTLILQMRRLGPRGLSLLPKVMHQWKDLDLNLVTTAHIFNVRILKYSVMQWILRDSRGRNFEKYF